MILPDSPPILLPVDLPTRDLDRRKKDRWTWQEWLAVAAAALLHAAVILWLFIDWPAAEPAQEPEAVPVKIVFAPPPPPPAPQPVPTPQPPASFLGNQSGKDERTTAPPPAETQADEATKPPPSQPEPKPDPKPTEVPTTPPADSGLATPPPPAKPKPPKAVARLDPRKEADTARAPHPAPERQIRVEPDDQERTGDPYLNHARDLIEDHRVYPRVLGQFGLPLEGTPVYAILVDRSGQLRGLKVVRSSGAPMLDAAGENMIRSAMPLPPLPSGIPEDLIEMTISIPLFPDRR
jgi:periplasmic protein TonB